MPTDYSWPRLRALADEALDSPRGIIVNYPSWHDAEMSRKNLYRFRDRQRKRSADMYPDPQDPRHGTCVYDALTFWIRSSIKRTDMIVTFHDEAEISEVERSAFLLEPDNPSRENEDLFPGKCVTLSVETPRGRAVVEYAPSFAVAWRILRQDFPAALIIENGYDTSHLDIERL